MLTRPYAIVILSDFNSILAFALFFFSRLSVALLRANAFEKNRIQCVYVFVIQKKRQRQNAKDENETQSAVNTDKMHKRFR